MRGCVTHTRWREGGREEGREGGGGREREGGGGRESVASVINVYHHVFIFLQRYERLCYTHKMERRG